MFFVHCEWRTVHAAREGPCLFVRCQVDGDMLQVCFGPGNHACTTSEEWNYANLDRQFFQGWGQPLVCSQGLRASLHRLEHMLFLRCEIAFQRDANTQQFVSLFNVEDLEGLPIQFDIVGGDRFTSGEIHPAISLLFMWTLVPNHSR
jgi:hypothetical protein